MQRLESQLGAKLEGMAAARQDAERLMMAVAKERDDVMVKNATLKDSLREARQRLEDESFGLSTQVSQLQASEEKWRQATQQAIATGTAPAMEDSSEPRRVSSPQSIEARRIARLEVRPHMHPAMHTWAPLTRPPLP